MANIKILIVVDSINVEDSSGSKANVALIKNLVDAGFEVLVYHYTLKNIQLSGVSCFAIPEIKHSYLYFLSRLQRVIWRNFNINLAPFLQKIFGFSFTFFNDTNSIKRALKKINYTPDLVITLSKGASFRFIENKYSFDKGLKNAVNARDLNPIVEPPKPDPTPTPEPNPIPMPPVTEQPDYPKENNALLKQILALLQSLVDKITSIFK